MRRNKLRKFFMEKEENHISWLRAVLAVLSCALLMAVHVYFLRLVYLPILEDYHTLANKLLVAPGNPKPFENAVIYSTLLLLPLYGILSWVCSGKCAWISKRLENIIPAMLLIAFVYMTYLAMSASNWLYVGGSLLHIMPFSLPLIILVSALPLLRIPSLIEKLLFLSSLLVFLAIITAVSLYNEVELPPLFHFNPIIFPLIEYFRGNPIGPELPSLYGLYPVFLAPVFKVIGLSFYSINAILSSLVSITCFFIGWFCYRVISNTILASITMMASFYFSNLGPRIFLSGGLIKEPYFQYFPIRMIFPAMVLVVLSFAVSSNRGLKYSWIAWAISIAALLWNLDSGLTCLAGTLAFVLTPWLVKYRTLWNNRVLFSKKIVQQIGWAMLIVIAVLSVFSLLFYSQTGKLPDILSYIHLVTTLSTVGFSFLLTPLSLHYWQIICFFYVCTFIYALALCTRTSDSIRGQLLSALSVMGLASMVYYFGRSHDYNIFGPSWILYIVIGFLAQELLTHWSRISYSEKSIFIIFSSFLSLAPMSLAYNFNSFYQNVSLGVSRLVRSDSSHQTMNLVYEFIRQHANDKGEAFLLSVDQEGLLLLGSGVHLPIQIPSSTDLFLKEDEQRIAEYLIDNRTMPVFVGANTSRSPVINSVLSRYYHLSMQGPGSIALFIRNE